jgi:hypothetical protein
LIGGVVVIAVATVLVLAGLAVWGGGGAAEAGVAGPGAPAGSGLGSKAGPGAASSGAVPRVGSSGSGDNSPGIAGSSSATGSFGSPSGRSDTTLDSSALAPPGGVEVPPADSSVNREWRVVGQSWQAVMARYKTAFPVPGYRLDRLIGDQGGSDGEGWSITNAAGDDAGHIAVYDDQSGSGGVLVDFEVPM